MSRSPGKTARLIQLAWYGDYALAALCWSVSGRAMPASRYRTWTRDELITEILRIEFAAAEVSR